MQRRSLVQDLLGAQQLKGKSFYLDGVKSRRTALLVEAIARFEGKVESFLNKDISFVISGSQEAWLECQSEDAQRVSGETNGVASSSPVSAHRRNPQTSSQRTATPRPAMYGSRGKALLEKAIRNNERCCGSSVLENARSWGVKIVHVDDFLWYIDRLTVETAQAKSKNVEKRAGEPPAPRVVKAGALKLPYLKIEDSSRKYRPLYLQSMNFPTLDHTGRFSPFEPPAPPPPQREKDQGLSGAKDRTLDPITSQEKLPTALPLTPSPRRARRKTVGYCECCQLAFKERDEHLKSDQHRGFWQNPSHYSVLDQLVAPMQPGFADSPIEGPATMRLPSLPALPLDSSLELDPQVHSETEKAIQALLTQGSPTWLGPHPGMVALGEQEVNGADSNPVGTTALPEADPVPLAALASPTATLGSLPPGPQPCRPETGSTGKAGDHGADPKQEKLAVEDGRPVPSSRRNHEPTEGGGETPETPLAPWPSLALNPRKRSRASSLDPKVSKRRRTTQQPMSDPALACLSVSESRRSPGHTPTFPRYKPPSVPVTPSLVVGCVGQPDVPRAADPRQEVELEVDEDLLIAPKTQLSNPPCHLSPLAHGHSTLISCGDRAGVTSLVLREHASAEPSPRSLPGVESLPIKVFNPLGTGRLPHPPSSFRQDASGVSDPALDISSCPRLFQMDFIPVLPLPCPAGDACCPQPCQDSDNTLSQSHSSVFIEAALLPDPSACSPFSSESEWDCGLLSRLIPAVPPPARGEQCLLDLELLQRPCAGMQDTSYEARLCSVLQPPTPPPSLCGDDTDPALCSRTPHSCLDACVILGLGVQH